MSDIFLNSCTNKPFMNNRIKKTMPIRSKVLNIPRKQSGDAKMLFIDN